MGRRNPITHVRQSAKRRRTPVVLTIDQIKPFVSHLKEPCRTAVLLDASSGRKPIPLDPELANLLLNLRRQCPYPQAHDWVFASPHRKSKQPYWPGALFRKHLKPALEAAQLPGDVGWHTLRHTFGTLMKANGEDIKTIQELLRHANYKVTADTYTQAVTPLKRAAQTKLVRMILPTKAAAGSEG